LKHLKLTIPPGVSRNDLTYTTGPRWHNSDKIRFHYGLPQRIGGWEHFDSTQLTGAARNLHQWRALDGFRLLSIGTTSHFYTYQGGTLSDVTPLRAATVSMPTDPYTTGAVGSTTVTVTNTSHGAVTAARYVHTSADAVGDGITITQNQEYYITKVDDNSFTITATTGTASSGSTAFGGGSVTGDYTINPGKTNAILGYGWGASTYSGSTFGTARTTSNVTLDPRIWTSDNWGEDLLASYTPNGKLYLFDESSPTARMTEVSNAPSQVDLVLISEPDRHAVAFGAHDGSNYDPLLIRWSDQEDYTTWTASATNTAGSQRLGSGNRIVAAKEARGQIYVWTDTTMYAMQYVGPPFTFGFQSLGKNEGPLGPHAAIVYNDIAYWKSDRGFYAYDGSIRLIECPVEDYIFDNLDSEQSQKAFAGACNDYNELWFFYQTKTATNDEIDRYAIYSILDGSWALGTLERTAWTDHGVWKSPLAVGQDNYIYEHELTTGVDANGSPLAAYVESGSFELGSNDQEQGPGDRLVYLDRLIPDIDTSGTVKFTLYTKRYPNGAETTKGPYSITDSTNKVDLRARGRTFRVRFENDDLGNAWRLGHNRVRMRSHGRR